jgi:GGDEF domain-containing protein
VSDEFLSPHSVERLARAARAAQTLSEALWEALHEELSDPRGQRVAELSERLTDVSATVALLARADVGASPIGASPTRTPAPAPTPEPSAAPARPEASAARVTRDEPPPSREAPARREPSPSPSAAVLVDELAPEAPQEIEIRDERGDRAPSPWVGSIERRLERYERDSVPFAVLLVELADVERLRHAELPGEVARLTGLVETALSNELRPADSLTRESPGRYWLLAPETDANSARALAGRLAEAVRGAASHRGASLQVAVGVAVCPVDGDQAATLAAQADVALYAARAAGRPLAP